MGKTSQLDSSVAARFLLGFEGNSLTGEMGALLERGLAGVAIFPRNFSSLEGLRSLTAAIRGAARRPVLIGIDQECGTKYSLPEPFTQWPSPAELGALNDPELVDRIARAAGHELRAAGVNLNFAPMLDLHTNPASPVTTERSFGAEPRNVGRLGYAFCKGMLREGILTSAKHFPGHGDTIVDPHQDLPVFDGTLQTLLRVDLVPFREVRHCTQVIMTAHILLPRIDPERPTSLSRTMLSGVLRKRLGFLGVILADDLVMGAIARRYGAGEAAVESFRAGGDMVMFCHDWSQVAPAIETVAEAYKRGSFDEAEWEA